MILQPRAPPRETRTITRGDKGRGATIQQRDELWGGLGVGGTYSWNSDKYALYSEVTVNTSLENFGDSYSVNGTGGFRIRW